MAHPDMAPFCITFTGEKLEDKETMIVLQEAMDNVFKETVEYEQKIAQELGVSVECAMDVVYLRSRSRWTEQLEKRLIVLHKAGIPPNVYEFGHDKQNYISL